MKKMLFAYSIITLYAIIYQPIKMTQGISGKIYVKQGNQMPSPGQPPNLGRPIKCEIFVYELTKREQAASNGVHFSNIQTKLVTKSESNDEGFYSLSLPPGQYSVFVNDNGQVYANSFDGKGNINPVTVKKDSVSNLNITISSRAVF